MKLAQAYNPYITHPAILSKVESLKARAELLSGLRKVVTYEGNSNLTVQQWHAINSQLFSVSNRLKKKLNSFLVTGDEGRLYRQPASDLINSLGEIEMELTQAYSFYDTYMDILTQRLSPEIGPLLRGCDVIAADGLKAGYLSSITMNPIVYCDRGFGASILREGVSISKTANPVSFITIPYSRLAEKYNLISIYHEVGHLALNKLGLVQPFQQVFATAVKQAGGNAQMQTMFANWSKEIVPDFWAFAHTGMAQTSSMRDILMVPQNMAFQVSPYQQHPPPYLRFLVSAEWCRYLWGRGPWDDWIAEWEKFYPVQKQDGLTRQLIMESKYLLPAAARAVINTSFSSLNKKSLTSLFDLDSVTPARLKALLKEKAPAAKQPPGVQLAVFRLLRDRHERPISEINKLIKNWLLGLGNNNSVNN